MDHRRDVEFDHLFVERIPPSIGQRRVFPVPAGRVRVEIAPNEAEFVDAALELGNAGLRLDARRLRQLAYTDEAFRVDAANLRDQVVADP